MEYKNKKTVQNGISCLFDQSVDLHRAIANSDAYIGDHSSLTVLYQMTGKPIMIQNVNSVVAPALEFHSNGCEGDVIYFSFYQFDFIFKMNLITGVIEHVGDLPNHKFYSTDSYMCVLKKGAELFFIGWNDIDLGILSFNEKSRLSTAYKFKPVAGISKYAFRNAVSYKEKVFFLPQTYPAILEFDLRTRDFIYHTIPNSRDTGMVIAGYGAFLKDNHIFLTGHNPAGLIIYNCDNGKFAIDSRFPLCSAVTFDGSYYWIVGLNRTVYKWDKENDLIQRHTHFPVSIPDSCSFSNVIFIQGYLVLLPIENLPLIKINVMTGATSELKLPCILSSGAMCNYLAVNWDNNTYIALFSRFSCEIMKYNVLTDEYTTLPISLSEDIIKNMRKQRIARYLSEGPENEMITENNIMNIEYFVNNLDEFQKGADMTKTAGENGRKIYDYCKNLILRGGVHEKR